MEKPIKKEKTRNQLHKSIFIFLFLNNLETWYKLQLG